MERCGFISDQQSLKEIISPFSFIMGYTVQAIQINKDLHFHMDTRSSVPVRFSHSQYKKIHMEGKVKG